MATAEPLPTGTGIPSITPPTTPNTRSRRTPIAIASTPKTPILTSLSTPLSRSTRRSAAAPAEVEISDAPESSTSARNRTRTRTRTASVSGGVAQSAGQIEGLRPSGKDEQAGGPSTQIQTPLPMPMPMPVPVPTLDEPEYLQPAEFFPLNNGVGGKPVVWTDSQWLSPEDDVDATRGIPIFRPTMEEFRDFEGYVTKTVPWGQYSGITKIIPPQEWLDSLPPITKQSLSDVRIKSPIQQNMLGKAGLFRVTNVEKNKARPLTVQQWYEKCTDKKHAAMGPKDIDRTLDRDSKEAKEQRAAAQAELKAKREERRRKLKRKEKDGGPTETDHELDIDAVPPLVPHSPHSQSSSDPIATTPEADPVDPFYHTFDPETAWLPKDTTQEDYTAEACSTLEKKLWKSLMTREPSWYGADLQGSLFVDKNTPWNVSNLPNLLNRCSLTKTLPGVNSPYLYFGMWGAMFAWHVEDMDLFSINYIHFGAPKFWYAVPQRHAERFEHVLAGYFPQDSRRCDQFLRHKSFTMSSTQLAQDRIPVNMLVHKQHEFVITYPKGYHAGFNMGFNCAESINFALESWLELGRRAKYCECVSHSVRINVDEMMAERELLNAIQEERRTKRPRKRAIESEAVEPRKRVRVVGADDASHDEDEAVDESAIEVKPPIPVAGMEQIRKKIRISKPPKASIIIEAPSYPCLFCPSLSTEGLIPVFEPSEAVKNHSKDLVGPIMAHHACAVALPELGLEDIEVDGKTIQHVTSVEDVPKDRWNLKCAACTDKKLAAAGAKIQCTKGKCPRAFHVSCAQGNDTVQYRTFEVSELQTIPLPEDAPPDAQPEVITVWNMRYELLCPTHNPVGHTLSFTEIPSPSLSDDQDMKEVKRMKQLQELNNRVMSILPGSTIKIKAASAIMEVVLLSSNSETRQCEVRFVDGTVQVIPFERLDFRAKAATVQNEYARTYNTNVAAGVNSPVKRMSTDSSSLAVGPPPLARRPPAPKPAISSSSSITNSIPPVLALPQPQKRIHPPPQVGVPAAAVIPLPPYRAHQPVPQIYQPVGPSGSSNRRSSQAPAYSVQELLNPAPNPPRRPHTASHHPPHHSNIPSRVVVCDSIPSQGPSGWTPHPVHYSPQTYPSGSYYHQYAPPPPSTGYYHQPAYLPPVPQHAPYPVHDYPAPDSRRSSQNGPAPPSWHPQPPQPYQSPSGQRSAPTPISGWAPPVQGPPSTQDRGSKIDLGLEHMFSLMRFLPPIRVPAIHIAGTNGKGSVSAILESCLLTAGLRVGRFNSPHLVEPRDAIRINGVPVELGLYKQVMSTISSIAQQHHLNPSPFERTTAAAYYLFNSEPVIDVMIIECGMGGTTDATNVIPPHLILASALTSVGMDHTSQLGNTLEAITEKKAGIAVRNGLLFLAPNLQPEVKAMAWTVGDRTGAAVIESGPSSKLPAKSDTMRFDIRSASQPPAMMVSTVLPDLRNDPTRAGMGMPPPTIQTQCPLGGDHQLDNLSLALAILHVLRRDHRALSLVPSLGMLNTAVIQHGVANTRWEGRCSWLRWKDERTGHGHVLPLLVDGAHNADSAKRLRQYIDGLRTGGSIRFIISLSSSPGKSVDSVLRPLLRPGDDVALVDFTCPVEDMPWVRPCDRHEVKSVVQALIGNGDGQPQGQGQGQGEIREFGSSGVRAMQSALEWAGEEWSRTENSTDVSGKGEPKLTVVCGSLYLVADVYRLLGRGV